MREDADMIPCTQQQGAEVGRPKTGETPIQHIRIPDEDWRAFNEVTGGKGAAVVRAFISWFLWKRGAKLPERPPRREA
jgi:hypothetical protein